MAPSIKELTTREVENIKREQLHNSVKELNGRLSAIERFIKRWWIIIVAFFTFISGIVTLSFNIVARYNELDKTDSAIKREHAIYRYADSLFKQKK